MAELDQHARNVIDTTFAYLNQALDGAGSSPETMIVCSYVLEALDTYVNERADAEAFQRSIDAQYEAATA